MEKRLTLFLAVILASGFCLAEEPAAPVQTATRQEVIAHDYQIIKAERNRILVLQDLTAQETDRLRKSEEEFCKTYNLDVKKFREGRYEYKGKEDKFVELPAPDEKKPTKSK